MQPHNSIFVLLVSATLVVTYAGCAQPATTPAAVTNLPAPINWSADQDHRNMMNQLGIEKLRPGAEGMNRQAPNYQNTDESKANPYPNLPDPLTLNDGEKVTTPEMWWKQRRPEIVEDFDREVYGRVPQKHAQGDLGSDQRHPDKQWRGPGHHQTTHWPRR